MKLNAIKQVCTRAKQFFIYNAANGQQWIGTQEVCYPVEGIRITEESVPCLFDLSEDKQEKMEVKTLPFEDGGLYPATRAGTAQLMIEEGMIPLYFRGGLRKPLEWNRTLYMLEVDKLKAAESTDGYVRFEAAENRQGETLVIVQDGFMVTGIMRPDPPEVTNTAKRFLKYMAFLRNETVREAEPPAEAKTGEQLEIGETEESEDE